MSKATLAEAELVGFLEAAYAVELSDRAWLEGALRAIAAMCGPDHQYLGFCYDGSDVENFKITNACAHEMLPEAVAGFDYFQTLLTPGMVRNTFRSLHTGSARRAGAPYLTPLIERRTQLGWGDIYNINGLDPSGIGCVLTIGCREPEFVPKAPEALFYRRVAMHLGAAFRCRRRLAESVPAGAPPASVPRRATEGAEAVLDPSGRVLHAEGAAATDKARERLKNAAAAIDSLRSNAGRKRGGEALREWHPLTGARWSLVDSFEENGRRYVVARENQSELRAFAALTDRERQVVVHAAMGMSTQQVAYALGISAATVRVLLSRAATRMGVRSRKELLEHSSLSELGPAANRTPEAP